MRLSTKGRFAVTAMIDVALRERLGPVPLSEISARHHISLSYLEQMFSRLRQAGLVTSTRGPGGGYTLGQHAEAITVADIIRTVEDAAPAAERSTPPDLAQDLWDSMNARVAEFMRGITLRALVLEQLAKGVQIEDKPAPTRGVFKKPTPLVQPVRTQAPNSVFALGQTLLARGGHAA